MPTTYVSKDCQHRFQFRFVQENGHIDIYCVAHPSHNGKDPDPHKTHLFSSGKVCIAQGREPTTEARAKELAAQWAEYFLEYRRTGVAQY